MIGRIGVPGWNTGPAISPSRLLRTCIGLQHARVPIGVAFPESVQSVWDSCIKASRMVKSRNIYISIYVSVSISTYHINIILYIYIINIHILWYMMIILYMICVCVSYTWYVLYVLIYYIYNYKYIDIACNITQWMRFELAIFISYWAYGCRCQVGIIAWSQAVELSLSLRYSDTVPWTAEYFRVLQGFEPWEEIPRAS